MNINNQSSDHTEIQKLAPHIFSDESLDSVIVALYGLSLLGSQIAQQKEKTR